MYVKLFGRMLQSSIMDEDVLTRWAFVVMLLSADREGVVYGTTKALARTANLPESDFAAALDRLMAPDPNSTTPDEDGRRVVLESANCWRVVNYAHYRDAKDEDALRTVTRDRVRRWRAAQKTGNAPVTPCNAPVTEGNEPKRSVTPSDAATDTDTDQAQTQKKNRPPISPPSQGDAVVVPAPVPGDKPPAKARPKGVPPTRLPAVLSAFSFWRTTCGHPKAVDPDPEGQIARRIDAVLQKHGRSYFDSICRGAAADPWEGRRKNDTLDILLREGNQERMRAMDPGSTDNQTSAPADNRTDEAKATKIWYDIAKTKPGIEPPQVAIIVDMLGPRTLDALKVIDSNPIRSILCITESSFDEKTRMKREFIQAWIHSGLNDDAEDVDE